LVAVRVFVAVGAPGTRVGVWVGVRVAVAVRGGVEVAVARLAGPPSTEASLASNEFPHVQPPGLLSHATCGVSVPGPLLKKNQNFVVPLP
jgi:hypothetical protein